MPKWMMWEEEHGYQQDERGPLPLITTLNYELAKRQEALSSHRLRSQLPNSALVPLVARVTIDAVGKENIPDLFARAYDFDSAPLIQNEQGRGADRYPGLLCMLPTPLKMGITAVALRQSPHPGSEWIMEGVDVLSTDPAALPDQMPQAFSWASPADGLRAQPLDPNLRVHMTDVGEVVVSVPKLTLDEALQARFESHIEQMCHTMPESLDERKELVPGIARVHVRDGVTMRDNMDQLTAYDFVQTAVAIGLSPGAGKGVYTRLATHIADRELSMLASRVSAKKLAKRTDQIYYVLDHTSRHMTGADILFDKGFTRQWWQLVIDREMVRETAQQLFQGQLRIEGVGPGMVNILRAMFDEQ